MQSGALGISSDKVALNCGISGNKSFTRVQVIFVADFFRYGGPQTSRRLLGSTIKKGSRNYEPFR